ncbi:MAG: hypothetical protein ACYDDO_14770 [Acidiferrobacterales bacterium]
MKLKSQQSVQRLAERIDALSLRERALAFTVVLTILIMIAANLLFAPLRREQQRLDQSVTAKLAQLNALNNQTADLLASRLADPDAANRATLAALQAQLDANGGKLANVTRGLVDPKEMTSLVRQMLEKNGALQLVRMENLPPVAVGDNAATGSARPAATPAAGTAIGSASNPGSDSEPVLYRHGMRIELKGRYLDIVRYLQALEGMPWKMIWGEVDLKTEKYPVADVTLVIYTLGFDRAWIGT